MGKLKSELIKLEIHFIFCSDLKETWFYSTSNNWTQGPDMIEYRLVHGCSSFRLNGNQILAVSPGVTNEKSVEFLDLAQENPKWMHGTFL